MKYNSILDTIGNTPVVKLNRLGPKHVTMFVKVESFNPMASVKDRLAYAIMKDAIDSGDLLPGQTVVEATSGNTGIALAMVCAVLGHPFVATMADSFSIERRKLMRALGAKVILTPAAERGTGMVKKAEELAEKHGWFLARQFQNPANPAYHRNTTGPEIWEQTEGKVDGFVCSSGTGGTIGGVSSFLKEKNKDIQIYLSDPKGSSLYNHIENGELKAEGGSITEGIGSSRVTANFAEAKIDGAFSIEDKESLPILYDLIKNEGLSLGTSCGVNIAGAIRLGKKLGPGKTIVTILCDKSDRYNSKMFNKPFLIEKGLPYPDWI